MPIIFPKLHHRLCYFVTQYYLFVTHREYDNYCTLRIITPIYYCFIAVVVELHLTNEIQKKLHVPLLQ